MNQVLVWHPDRARVHTLIQLAFFLYSKHHYSLWSFLSPVEHLALSRTQFVAWFGFVDNVQALCNSPYISSSDDEKGERFGV